MRGGEVKGMKGGMRNKHKGSQWSRPSVRVLMENRYQVAIMACLSLLVASLQTPLFSRLLIDYPPLLLCVSIVNT
jgi:hypothetical protein